MAQAPESMILTQYNKMKLRDGFTLMETIVALGVATIALSFFILAMAPATVGIERSNSKKTAQRMAASVENELNTIRDSEISNYVTESSFEKAFDWIQRDGESGQGLLVAFDYRANSQEPPDVDGLLPAFDQNDYLDRAVTDQQQMILQTRVTEIDDLGTHINSIEGTAYVIKLRQMQVAQDGTLSPATDGTVITNSIDSSVASDITNFTDGLIVCQAQIYQLRANTED